MSHVGQKSRKCAMWAKNNLSHQFLQLNEVLNSFSFSSIPSILCALMIDPPAASNFSHFCAKIRTWTNYGIKSSPPIPASWTLSLLFTASSAHNNFICWLQSADSEASRLMGICREGEGGRGTVQPTDLKDLLLSDSWRIAISHPALHQRRKWLIEFGLSGSCWLFHIRKWEESIWDLFSWTGMYTNTIDRYTLGFIQTLKTCRL